MQAPSAVVGEVLAGAVLLPEPGADPSDFPPEEGVKDLKTESDVQEPAEPEDDLDIMLGNKEKKKKNVKFPEEDEMLENGEALEDEDSKKDDVISFSNQIGPAWAGSEKDYTYEELLNRVFNIMREKNPAMVAGEKRKFVMKPPQVI
ncbi:Eukaryotic translation initiation factor 2 subunit 2 [Plecturocebus cupreus]